MSIFAIVLLFVFPLAAFAMLFFDLIFQNKKQFFLLVITIILFFWVGLNYVPDNDSDLVRYFSIVQIDKGYTVPYFYSNMISSGHVINIVQDSLFFFVSRLDNQQILPGITTSLAFFSGFFIFLTGKKKIDSSILFKILALLTFLALMRIDIAAGNVRNISAVGLIMIGIISYDFLGKSYFIQLLFFLLGISMHIGILPIVVIKVGIDLLYSGYKNKWLTFLSLTLLAIVSFIFLIRFGILDSVFGKFTEYSTGDVATSAWFQLLQASLKFKLYKYVIVFYLVFTAILSYKQLILFKSLQKFNIFYIITSLVTIIFALTQPGSTFLRYFYVQIMLSPLVIMNHSNKAHYKKLFIILTSFFILFFLYYQFYYIEVNVDRAQFLKDTFLYPIWFER
ncbi:hypothetical protein AAYR18_00500 [Leuconostoc fallax]|uniref:hypothetical protein n=1 Tax=Leuconostoc fallax TaxID=1251 RepID=UPI0020914045|nr:hypothetical protein [Leuconostoc fallax]MCO6183163.1 hypothetical protein [Leuconostoc fallax]